MYRFISIKLLEVLLEFSFEILKLGKRLPARVHFNVQIVRKFVFLQIHKNECDNRIFLV